MKKQCTAWLLLLCMALSLVPALAEQRALTDNWYEVFVASYYDSDGDRMGDLRGLTEKLDYISDMGFGGLWLMPIHPSPSYHKYDVTDYCAIDPDYGTLEDFRALLARAHELGIRVILDLVVNHTSSQHPWFLSAMRDKDSPYRAYYNFYDEAHAGCSQLSDGTWYEARFVSSMPDLNLDSEAVRQEITDIMRYWLDMGVDGFRLDAVTSYYTGDKSRNIAFLRWLKETAAGIKPDSILIGECWDSLYTIKDYYASGIDSFFCFPVAQGGGYIAKILSNDVEKKGESYGNVTLLLERELGDVLVTPFLGNHDTARIANALGYQNATNIKMAAGLLAMMRGSIFVYYGDETGMIGSGADQNKRIGMFWDRKMNITRCPAGTTQAEYPFPSVEKQQQDALSILNYYKRAMHLRTENPEIARGRSTVLESNDPNVCLIVREDEGQRLLIIINLNIDDTAMAVPDGFGTLCGELEIWGSAAISNGQITVPAYGIALMR